MSGLARLLVLRVSQSPEQAEQPIQNNASRVVVDDIAPASCRIEVTQDFACLAVRILERAVLVPGLPALPLGEVADGVAGSAPELVGEGPVVTLDGVHDRAELGNHFNGNCVSDQHGGVLL